MNTPDSILKIGGQTRTCHLDTTGSAAAEFAIIIPLLLLLIVGIYEFGHVYWIRNTLQYAAEQTGRCVMAQSNNASSGDVTSITASPCNVNDYLGGLTGVSPATSQVQCRTISGTNAQVLAYCRSISLTYSVSNSTDPMWQLLWGVMNLVSQGAAGPSLSLVGFSEVPIAHFTGQCTDPTKTYPNC